MKELEGSEDKTFDELKKQIDSVVTRALRDISNLPSLESNINDIYHKLEDIETKLESFEKTLQA